MAVLNGKLNLRDFAEFGFLEVGRGPSSQIMRAEHTAMDGESTSGGAAASRATIANMWPPSCERTINREIA
jgi:hypothetical protein